MRKYLPRVNDNIRLFVLVFSSLSLLALGAFALNWAVSAQIGGGSAVDLSQILDSNFNLSVSGTIEGRRIKALSGSGAPFVISSTSLVSNLNADLLDGQHGVYYLDLDNQTGTCSNCLTGAEINESSLSGLDAADTLDGLDSSAFLRSNTSDTFSSGTLTLGSGTTLDVSLAGLSLANSQINWAKVSKTGSSLADLSTRSASSLSSGNLDIARLPTGGNWDISSDLSVETDTLLVGADGGSYEGRVGVGTATPEEALHVGGNALIEETGTSTGLNDGKDSYSLNLRGSGWVAPGWMSPTVLEFWPDHGGGRFDTQAVMGDDGFLRIVYYDDYNDVFKYVRCLNQSCSSRNTSTIDSSTSLAKSSIALGSDGLARIAYVAYPGSTFTVKFARCTDQDCTSPVINTIEPGENQVSLALDSSDNAFISYNVADGLGFARCLDQDCSSVNTTVAESDSNAGLDSSIAIGGDGFARITHIDNYSFGPGVRYVQCTNLDCTSSNKNWIISSTGASHTSIAMGPDGFARVAYYNTDTDKLEYARCTNDSCSSKVTTVIDDAGPSWGMGMGTRGMRLGSDGYARIGYRQEVDSLGTLKFVECFNDDCDSNSISTINTGNTASSRQYISLALTSGDRPFMTYYLGDSGVYEVHMVGQLVGYAETREFSLTNVVTDSTSYKLSVKDNFASEIFSIDQAGDITASGGLTASGAFVGNWSVTGTDAGQAGLFTITNSTTSGNQYGLYIDNADSTGTTDSLIVLDNSDTNTAVTTGIRFADAGGGFTTGIDMGAFTLTNIGDFGTDFDSSGGLTLAGSLTIGSSGTAISRHISSSSSIDIASVSAQSCANTSFSVSGASTGDTVVATPTPVAGGIETLNLSWNAYVSSSNTVQIRVCNPTAGALDPASQTWRVDVWKH